MGEKWIPLSQATPEQKAMYQKGAIKGKQIRSYNIGNVFDISQTNYPKENYPQLYQMGYEDGYQAKISEGLKNYSENRLSCPVETKNIDSIALRGMYYPGQHRIEMNELLNDSEYLSTLIHELGHALLHQRVEGKSTNQVEFEADALAVMLETSCGIELTDSRKAHLAAHYKMFSQELNHLENQEISKQVGNVFTDVFDVYRQRIEGIQFYIDKELPVVIEKEKMVQPILDQEKMKKELKPKKKIQPKMR